MTPARPGASLAGDGERDRTNASAVAVERAVDVLFLLAERGESTVTDLARTIGSSASAVHRILVALRRKGLVEQRSDTEGYFLSWSVLALGRSLNARTNLRTVAIPFMTELRDLTGETVSLNVRIGHERMCVDQVESTHEVRWVAPIGVPSPLYAGATGWVLLAHSGARELESYLAGVERAPLTPYTVVDPDTLRRALDTVRANGYAVSSQDRIAGLAGISAPIFDSTGAAVAAVTVGGRADRLKPQTVTRWAPALKDAAARVTEMIGGRRHPAGDPADVEPAAPAPPAGRRREAARSRAT
jgi:IclR family transcriptional regulator, KDG regulon repressor